MVPSREVDYKPLAWDDLCGKRRRTTLERQATVPRKMEIFDGHHRDSRDLRGETRPVMTRVAACAMCMSMWGPRNSICGMIHRYGMCSQYLCASTSGEHRSARLDRKWGDRKSPLALGLADVSRHTTQSSGLLHLRLCVVSRLCSESVCGFEVGMQHQTVPIRIVTRNERQIRSAAGQHNGILFMAD